jgi:hypothetical protein
MELEPIRTVLSNEVCEITVCQDQKRMSEGRYTVISVQSSEMRRYLAVWLASENLFAECGDFVGSFIHLDKLDLVFRYTRESRLEGREALYAKSFADCKAIAVSFVTAVAESGLGGDIGMLLLRPENIHVSPVGKITLSYFLDFSELKGENSDDNFFRAVAAYAFELLCWEYRQRYERQINLYPHELQLMYRKMQNKGFSSYSEIIAFIRSLSDTPREQRFGAARALDFASRVKTFILSHSMGFFVGILVLVTLFYLGYQIALRLSVGRDIRNNTSYAGLQTVGELYLGEANI